MVEFVTLFWDNPHMGALILKPVCIFMKILMKQYPVYGDNERVNEHWYVVCRNILHYVYFITRGAE